MAVSLAEFQAMTLVEKRQVAESLLGKKFRERKCGVDAAPKQVTEWRQEIVRLEIPIVQVRMQSVRLEDGELYGQAEYWRLEYLLRECEEITR